MTLGEKKEGRSAFNKHCENEENVLARKKRTELWCQVYGHLQDTTCSWRRRVGEIQIGGRMSMQMTEKWTIYRYFSLLK